MSRLYSILAKLPSSIHDGARMILDAMLTSKHLIGWDSDLRLMVNDRIIPGTNIANLLAHALYPYNPEIKDPAGFDYFIKALHNIGLESEWVNNEIAKNILNGMQSEKDESDSESGDDDDVDTSDDDETDDDDMKENSNTKTSKKHVKWLSMDDDDDNNKDDETDDEGEENSNEDEETDEDSSNVDSNEDNETDEDEET